MKNLSYPYLATLIGVAMLAVLVLGSRPGAPGQTALPLLTLLTISEVAFFVTAIGALLGARRLLTGVREPRLIAAAVACTLLALRFALYLYQLWPL